MVVAATVVQLGGLVALSQLGRWVVAVLHLPLPGNVLGMLVLYTLLALGVVRAEWLEPAAGLFNRHLAFFFIPLVVGLLGLPSSLVRGHGIALVAILVVTAAAGVAVTGGLASRWDRGPEEEQ